MVTVTVTHYTTIAYSTFLYVVSDSLHTYFEI